MSARDRSCGTSTSTGPGRPVRAMWKASWIAFGISRGSWIRIECFTIGLVMPEMSASWKPSVPISSVRTWPVMNTVGTLSIIASAVVVTRFVAPERVVLLVAVEHRRDDPNPRKRRPDQEPDQERASLQPADPAGGDAEYDGD